MNKTLYDNILKNIPNKIDEEIIENLINAGNVRIERIISHGQASPECFWYDQDENEFVIVLSGYGQIKFEDGEIVDMKEGDWLYIPAHKKHRVEQTDKENKTVWLAVFFK